MSNGKWVLHLTVSGITLFQCLKSKLISEGGWETGLPGSGKARCYLRAPGASPISFAAVNYWVSTCLQFWNKLWWLLILDYSFGPKCFDNNCPQERVRNTNYSIVEVNKKKKAAGWLHCYRSPAISHSVPSYVSCKVHLPINRTRAGSTKVRHFWPGGPATGALGIWEMLKT